VFGKDALFSRLKYFPIKERLIAANAFTLIPFIVFFASLNNDLPYKGVTQLCLIELLQLSTKIKIPIRMAATTDNFHVCYDFYETQ